MILFISEMLKLTQYDFQFWAYSLYCFLFHCLGITFVVVLEVIEMIYLCVIKQGKHAIHNQVKPEPTLKSWVKTFDTSNYGFA